MSLSNGYGPEGHSEENGEQVPHTDNMASYKRIIVCIDGTWLAADSGNKNSPTNVALLARSISSFGKDKHGKVVSQVVSYHSGLASGDLPGQRAICGGLGWGLDRDVCQVYEFIADNYSPGDELFFFGFSRGAFTARSVAGLISDVGILNSVNMSRFPDMYNAYRENTNGEPFHKTAWFINHAEDYGLDPKKINIKVIGVWESVGALGVPEWPLTKALQSVGIALNKMYAFHNTNVSPRVEHAFQALALDEQRLTFPPTMWHLRTDAPAVSVNLEQCWFPGQHSNLGGQAEDPLSAGDGGEIGNISFAWMVDNLSGLLTFEKDCIKTIIATHKKAIEESKVAQGWGCGPIVSNFAGLQGAFFRLLGKQVRTPGRYQKDPGDGYNGPTRETIHPTVRLRMEKVKSWNPAALNGWTLKKSLPCSKKGKGWRWVNQSLEMPEWQMGTGKITVASQPCHGGGCEFTEMESLSRTMCPKSILLDIDFDNGVAHCD